MGLASLVAARNLKSLLGAPSQFYDKFRIVEANVGRDALEQFKSGHIDRAVYFDTMECVEATPLLPRNLPNRECFKDYVGSLGISNKHHLIFYDRSPFGFYAAPRLWWLFRVCTLETKCPRLIFNQSLLELKEKLR
jgi:3-mercaptopyruvate sulfurtransferase SseA